MFKKIHSENGKSATAEAWKAMGPIFAKGIMSSKKLLTAHPKKAYVLMLILIFSSLIFNFYPRSSQLKVNRVSLSSLKISPLEAALNGLDKIGETGRKIRENLSASAKVDSLLAKDSLSHKDSVFLLQTLQIIKPIKR